MTVVPVGVGLASTLLGVSPAAVRKLAAAGLLADIQPSGGGARKFDLEKVQELAAWPSLDSTARELIGPIVHVGEPFTRKDGSSAGWGGAVSGWDRWWRMGAGAARSSIGRLLVADIAGFIPRGAVRRITSYQREDGVVAFGTEPASPDERAAIEEHRIQPMPGGAWQWANPKT